MTSIFKVNGKTFMGDLQPCECCTKMTVVNRVTVTKVDKRIVPFIKQLTLDPPELVWDDDYEDAVCEDCYNDRRAEHPKVEE